jgi:hypothetical protein
VSWFSGCEYVEQGLPTWAAGRLTDYKADFDLDGNDTPTVFHAGLAVQSRHLPAAKGSNATSSTSSAIQTQLSWSWTFTNAIVKDLEQIATKCKPILISIGIDGFACNVSLILPVLKRVLEFTWIIREICYGMSEKVFQRYQSGPYYGVFDSSAIINGIEPRSRDDLHGFNDGIELLLQDWDALQAHKDACKNHKVGRTIGRSGNHRGAHRPDVK